MVVIFDLNENFIEITRSDDPESPQPTPTVSGFRQLGEVIPTNFSDRYLYLYLAVRTKTRKPLSDESERGFFVKTTPKTTPIISNGVEISALPVLL